MTPKKSSDRGELLARRIVHEQEWAYARWLEHRSYRQMRIMANAPIAEGGLGYDLSLDALRGLVAGYRETHGEQTMTRAEHIDRELHDLDLAQQLALASMRKAADAGALDVHGTKLYAELGAQRRKLLGLDMPAEVKVDVTNHDAVTEELNAMLARLGEKPIEVRND